MRRQRLQKQVIKIEKSINKEVQNNICETREDKVYNILPRYSTYLITH